MADRDNNPSAAQKPADKNLQQPPVVPPAASGPPTLPVAAPAQKTEQAVAIVTEFINERYVRQVKMVSKETPAWEPRAGRSDEQIDREQGIKFNKDLRSRLVAGGFELPPLSGNTGKDGDVVFEGLYKQGVLLNRVNGKMSLGDQVMRLDSCNGWELNPEVKSFKVPSIALNGVELPKVESIDYREVKRRIISDFPGMEANPLNRGFNGITFNGAAGRYVTIDNTTMAKRAPEVGLTLEQMREMALINESAHMIAGKMPMSRIPPNQSLGTFEGKPFNVTTLEEAFSDLATLQHSKTPAQLASVIRVQFRENASNYQLCRALTVNTIEKFLASPYRSDDSEHKFPLVPKETADQLAKRNELGPIIEHLNSNPAASSELQKRLIADYQRVVSEGFKAADKIAKEKYPENAK